MYLRCLIDDRPRQWLRCLLWAEYCYNMSSQSFLREMAFKVVYGRAPPSLRPYSEGTTHVAAVDELLSDRDQLITDVKDRLLQAQQCYKRQFDMKHRALEFSIGHWVWLCLHHRQAASIAVQAYRKLAPCLLKPYQGEPLISPPALPELHHGQVCPVPRHVIRARKARGKSWSLGAMGRSTLC